MKIVPELSDVEGISASTDSEVEEVLSSELESVEIGDSARSSKAGKPSSIDSLSDDLPPIAAQRYSFRSRPRKRDVFPPSHSSNDSSTSPRPLHSVIAESVSDLDKTLIASPSHEVTSHAVSPQPGPSVRPKTTKSKRS